MSKPWTTTRIVARLTIVAGLVIGIGLCRPDSADASHVDRGCALGGKGGSALCHHRPYHPSTRRAPQTTSMGTDGAHGKDDDILLVQAPLRPLSTQLVKAGAGASARLTVAPQQGQDLHAFIEPLSPRPNQVLAINSVHAYIAARIAANAAIVRVKLRLDGLVLHPEILGRDDVDETIFYQPQRWKVGRHTVQVHVWDAAGQITERAWTFRIS
jgi:hypothetical protein